MYAVSRAKRHFQHPVYLLPGAVVLVPVSVYQLLLAAVFLVGFRYDGFLLYASTEEILIKATKKLRLGTPISIRKPEEGQILKIDRAGHVTMGNFIPRTTYPHWWRYRPYYGSFLLSDDEQKSIYGDLFDAARSMGVSEGEVQALLDCGCDPDEIEELLYDPALLHEMTGELLYAY